MRLTVLLIVLTLSIAARSQQTVLSVGGSQALTIRSGTTFSAGGLVLTPGADFTLSSNTIQLSPTAVDVAPAPGINRVYYFSSQITFTGTIQLYYQPSELNGNPESALQYTDSAIGGFWLASPSSTVNTTAHFVQQAATARPFIAATASHQGTVLALSLMSFSGTWAGSDVGLSWVVNQIGESADYSVERRTEGTSWTAVGAVSGKKAEGLQPYQFLDIAPPAGALMYRLTIRRNSGEVGYSNIVKLQKDIDSRVRLNAYGRSLTVHFDGIQPSGVSIVDAAGKLIRTDQTSRQSYVFDGLQAGVYYLRYELNGRAGARSFLINY